MCKQAPFAKADVAVDANAAACLSARLSMCVCACVSARVCVFAVVADYDQHFVVVSALSDTLCVCVCKFQNIRCTVAPKRAHNYFNAHARLWA